MIRAGIPLAKAKEALAECGALALDPGTVSSEEGIRLAAHLSSASMASRTNVANGLAMETLLWLSGKSDIRRAMAMMGPRGQEMVLVCWSEPAALRRRLKAEELPLALGKEADWQEIERISLSRIR